MVSALAIYYESAGVGEQQLEADLAMVAREMLSGVTVTSVSFEGAGGAGVVNRKPAELLPLLKQVRDKLAGIERVDRAQAGFGSRYLRT